MIANRHDIIQFIPQRNPFVAIHTIVEASEESAETQFQIEQESIFVSGGKIGEAGLLENMAQTAAAQMGYICHQKSEPVPIGYIGSVKNFIIHSFPAEGNVLTTKVQVTNRVLGAILVKAITHSNEQAVCECELRVFIK